MNSNVVPRSGCLIAVLAPLTAMLLYPRAKWLFLVGLGAFLFVVGTIVVLTLLREEIPPKTVADHAEKLLEGQFGGWAVDDFEHLNPRNGRVKELWQRTIEIGGMPESWVSLDEDRKRELRKIIEELRNLNFD